MDILNNREIVLGPESEILLYKTEANAEKRREFIHECVFPVLCHNTRGLAIARIILRAAGRLLAAAGADARQRARG
jgi:hypothetical protein